MDDNNCCVSGEKHYISDTYDSSWSSDINVSTGSNYRSGSTDGCEKNKCIYHSKGNDSNYSTDSTDSTKYGVSNVKSDNSDTIDTIDSRDSSYHNNSGENSKISDSGNSHVVSRMIEVISMNLKVNSGIIEVICN